ncbi:MAG: PadR family transcriptional regulator [bacterium]
MSKDVKIRDLVVLGLLSDSPRYGYEIKMIIDNVMSHIVDISSGSLYYGLKKLENNGFVRETGTERVGNRPERSVYEITDDGRRMLRRELPKVIFPHSRPIFPVNLGLYFLDAISEKEQCRRFLIKEAYLKRILEYHREVDEQTRESTPLRHQFIMRHTIMLIEMEIAFCEEVFTSLVDRNLYELDDRDHEEIDDEFERLKKTIHADQAIIENERDRAASQP